MRSQAIPIAQLDPKHYLDKQQDGSAWLNLVCLCGAGFVAIYYFAGLVGLFYDIILAT
jgi:hypothetical protein